MTRSLSTIRSWLYAPGNRLDLIRKIPRTSADAAIIDLEDAVPPGQKANARSIARDVLVEQSERSSPGGPVWGVRINHPLTSEGEADLRSVITPATAFIRVPKVQSAAELQHVDSLLRDMEQEQGIADGGIKIVAAVETALGLLSMSEWVRSSLRLHALGYGAADLTFDLGLLPEESIDATLVPRSLLVIQSRAASLAPPIDGVHAYVRDVEGLRSSTARGRALGYFGRTAIHPTHLDIINDTYTPTPEEVDRAHRIVEAASAAEDVGSGALQLQDGTFVDTPIVKRAQRTLSLHQELLRQDFTREA